MFVVLEAGELMVVDPNLEEEAAASGLMTVIVNAFGELCAVQKTSGIWLPNSDVIDSPLQSKSNTLCSRKHSLTPTVSIFEEL